MANSRTPALRQTPDTPRVAIVHEWLTNWAGSEKCVDQMRVAFPQHHIYTSVMNEKEFPGWRDVTTTSRLHSVPPFRRSHLRCLPLIPFAMGRLPIRPEYDLVIRSFHSFATWPQLPRVQAATCPEIVYCYTPPRFIYRQHTLRGERRVLARTMRLASGALRNADVKRMQNTQRIIGISTAVAARIRNTYGLDASVVYPPVDVERFRSAMNTPTGDYWVFLSRLVPYKKPDLAIEAFRGIDQRLVVIGDGRLRSSLERSAPPNVTFAGRTSDSELPKLLAGARGFVFPSEEDFGIAPVEALAAGVPVVAYGAGGALDYVKHEQNGMLVSEQSVPAFRRAVEQAGKQFWDRGEISRSADKFSSSVFVASMRQHAAGALTR